jgi:hypothetical protein
MARHRRREAGHLSRANIRRAQSGRGVKASGSGRSREGSFMLDVIVLAIGLGFFVLSVGYAYGCERL